MKIRFALLSAALIMLLLLSGILVTGCGTDDVVEPDDETVDEDVEISEEDKYGGTINCAIATTVAHLDTDLTTDSYMGMIMSHVYEGLFEIDASYNPTPHLVESFTVENDGLEYYFKLREGVKFHNGKEMTSEDVYASMNRWLTVNGGGSRVAPFIDEVEILGDYEIAVYFNTPYAPFLSFMSSIVANQKLVVRPSEIIEQYGEDVIEEHIGTGPYTMDEYAPDQYVRLARFDDYAAHPGPSFAYSGTKHAYADEVIFWMVPEQSVRVAGVQSGEYHFAELVPKEQMSQFEADPNVIPQVIDPFRQSFIIVNMGYPPFDNIYARQAMLHSFDMEQMGLAMIGDPEFWYLESSLFIPGNRWHVPDAGAGKYNAYDPDKAKELLEMSGYDGTPIIILNGSDNPIERAGALAAQEQLESVGFNVEVELYDRATVVEQRSRVDGWNLHFSQFTTPDPDPIVYGAWMGTNKWIGNWDDEDSAKMDDIFERMAVEVDFDKRYEIVEEWHEAFYEYVPYVKVLYFNELAVNHISLKGYEPFPYHVFFNTWLEE
jgi:peptide/nickel transport system substrate-binding protein